MAAALRPAAGLGQEEEKNTAGLGNLWIKFRKFNMVWKLHLREKKDLLEHRVDPSPLISVCTADSPVHSLVTASSSNPQRSSEEAFQ